MESEKKLILNREQEAAAYCPENAVVCAGAGSGKTMVLASRYVWLVTEKNCRVSEILTLTFTKKAAAQMYRRIHLELADKAKEPGEKGILARRALDEFACARIQTLDSYSAAIVRQAANRYGISPDFTTDEDRCFRLALDEALPFLISNRNHPALERLYHNKSPASITGDIFASTLFNYTYIDSPPNPRRDIHNQFEIICREWHKQTELLQKKFDELAEVYQGNIKYHPDLAPLLDQYTNSQIKFPKEQEVRTFFDRISDMPHKTVVDWAESNPLQESLINTFAFMASVVALDMRKGTKKNNPARDILYELRNLFGEFSSLVVFCRQAGLIYSLLMLLSDLQNRYLNLKRAEGIVTFNDIARLARTILLEQHDIRQSEKETFKAIMIDEFQDNNELQKDLLFLMAEDPDITGTSIPQAHNLCAGKLFFVGDEKQSIYRFRGADVSVFRKLNNELGSRDLSLSVNYRSDPQLIEAFNVIFSAVFTPPSSNLPSYEALYSPLRAHKAADQAGKKLTLCILDKIPDEGETEILSSTENEARFVAEKIKSLLQKYQPGDIAILFRSRRSQHYFEKHLMLLNIPYTSEDLNNFFYGGPVNDMMSVLRLVAYPTDRAAFAQMLRSPFAGLSLPGLAVCLSGADDVPFNDEPLSQLTDEDREQYLHGRYIYQKILAKSCTESISSLLSELWHGEGYRYETEWNPKTAAFRELYDYLFHLAVQADENNQGLAAFTDFILSMDKPGERLSGIEIPLDRRHIRSAVHLTTVHKSKGLEYPVVFLVCCDRRGRNDISDDIFDSGTGGITLNPPLPQDLESMNAVRRNYFWERSLTVEKGKKTAELRRLLYVGMTRAENELYLCGSLGISRLLESDNDAGSFSVQLRKFITIKTAEKAVKNTITGDIILNDNTFFGLCLPVFGEHIPEDGTDPSFFGIEQIPAYSEQYIQDAEQQGSRFTNDQKGVYSFFKTTEPFYRDALIIETPVVPKKHFTPTALPPQTDISARSFAVNKEHCGEHGKDIFENVDTLIERYAQQYGDDREKFNHGCFGTIAHICVESLLAGQEAVIPPKLAGFLAPTDADIILEAGKELALRFIHSPLGIMARNSEKRKSEFPFRSLVCIEEIPFFINGIIDLVFEDAVTVHVVDFKTDSEEQPWLHVAQMTCYHQAMSDLFAEPAGKQCRVWLYYLRTGRAVEVFA